MIAKKNPSKNIVTAADKYSFMLRRMRPFQMAAFLRVSRKRRFLTVMTGKNALIGAVIGLIRKEISEPAHRAGTTSSACTSATMLMAQFLETEKCNASKSAP
jgi:hypothetical protein